MSTILQKNGGKIKKTAKKAKQKKHKKTQTKTIKILTKKKNRKA